MLKGVVCGFEYGDISQGGERWSSWFYGWYEYRVGRLRRRTESLEQQQEKSKTVFNVCSVYFDFAIQMKPGWAV
jgi:hypothetical protein